MYFDLGYRGTGVEYTEYLELNAVISETGLGTKSVSFKPVPVRWRVERTSAWATRFRRLANNFERTVKSWEAFAWLGVSSLWASGWGAEVEEPQNLSDRIGNWLTLSTAGLA